MFRVWLILTLASFCQADMNLRLEKSLLKMRQNKFLPRYLDPSSYLRRTLHAGAVRTKPRDLGPYSYLRRMKHAGAVRDKPRDLGPYTYLQQTLEAGEEMAREEPRDLKALSNPLQQKKTYESPKQPNFDNSNFCPVPKMEQKGAYVLAEEFYPFLGRVVANDAREKQTEHRFMCTAVLVKEKCYMTAASCINTAKTLYTSVLVLSEHYPVRAFILPDNPSKQMFDDIGLIIIFNWDIQKNSHGVTHAQEPIHVTKSTRSGVGYEWFDKMNLNNDDNYVLGFLPEHDNPDSVHLYKLKEMRASTTLCNKILPAESNSNDYEVPCAHSCSIDEHFQNNTKCHRYMLGLGHVLLDKSDRLIGIVTWSCGNHAEDRLSRNGLPLPVGISVPNKDTLALDYKCVDKIVRHPHPEIDLVNNMTWQPTDFCW